MRRSLVLVALISALVLVPPGAAKPPQVLFDDFNYGGFDQSFQLWHHGWTIRTAPGWPGVRGAAWSRAGISFAGDPANHGNRFLRLTSSTDGTPAGVDQAEICQRRKFFDGTYATRVRFSDRPVSGPDGDQLVETFYAISPLRARLDPKYSELQVLPRRADVDRLQPLVHSGRAAPCRQRASVPRGRRLGLPPGRRRPLSATGHCRGGKASARTSRLP
jgi:hypothetical protein